MPMKLVLKVGLNDDLKEKQKAMKAVSSLSGVDSLSMDMKDQKLTVVGDVDPVQVVGKLRKNWHTDILTVGPAKEPEKPKDDAKKKEDDKKQGGDKKKTDAEIYAELLKQYRDYNPYPTQHYFVHSAEENPNACVIC